MDKDFEPTVIGFFCNWCSYTGADLAGVSRIKYPPNLLPIRVMCSGRVDPFYVALALKKGADGVLIGGCHIGDCHYLKGNRFAERRVSILKDLLDTLGIDARRVRLEWISASEGGRFAEVVTDFVAELKKLGPNPLKEKVHDKRSAAIV